MIGSMPLTGTNGCMKSMSMSAASRLEEVWKEWRGGDVKREVRRGEERWCGGDDHGHR